MALQGPFFGKREDAPLPRAPGTSTLGGTSSLGSANGIGGAQPFASAASAQAAATAPSADSGAKLTVGPNIKLKGVEITDCDTLVVEGTVEATMNSRVIQIAEQGAFKGSAEIDIAEVRGVFDGNLTVRQKLVIFSTGKVTGKIRYGKIVIEEGGQLSGDITFGTASGGGDGKPAVKAEPQTATA
ncbi:MAG: polymer-forming cytoskeletal protein [Pseudomonadota bacterium]|nr:polymer-forming cytoskeletal protein [Pseudomonadota bacterium]